MTLTFPLLHQLGYTGLAIAPKGSRMTGGPKQQLVPEKLGKTPTRRTADGLVYSGGWPSWTFTDEAARHYQGWREAHGDAIGVRGGDVLAMDVDVNDPVTARKIREIIERHAGSTVVRRRTGGSPKILMMYRVVSPMRKVRLAWVKNGQAEAVERLGLGQYWNLVGQHPSGDAYELEGPLPPKDELPALTEGQSDAIFADLEALLRSKGIVPAPRTGSSTSSDRANVDQDDLAARDWPALRAKIAEVPQQDWDYHTWAEGGIPAVFGAAGPQNRDDAIDAIIELSSKHPDPIDPDALLKKLASYRPPYALGEGTVVAMLAELGVDMRDYVAAGAQAEFAVIQPAPEVTVVPAPVDPRPRDEQLAALTGDAGVVFAQYPGDNPRSTWPRLAAAAKTAHPLRGLLVGSVLPAAKNAPQHPVAFELMTRGALTGGAGWAGLTDEQQSLLIEASSLVLQRGQRPRRFPVLLADLPPREWQVEGLLSRDMTALVVGAPKAGKSHVALYLAHLLGRSAEEPRLASRAVTPGRVAYFTSEGQRELFERRKRLDGANGPSPNLWIFDGVPSLVGHLEDAVAFVRHAERRAGGSFDLIVIDTFAGAAGSLPENESWSIGPAMQKVRQLGQLFGSSVIVVHHASKAKPDEARGSSAFNAEVDLRLSVTSSNRGIRLRVEPSRSVAAGADFWFNISKDGLLQMGPAIHRADEYDTDIGAAAVGRLVQDLGEATDAVVKEHLAELWPEHFGKDAKGVRQRYSRVAKRAFDQKYVEQSRGQLVPGEVTPSLDAGELDVSGSLVGTLGAKTYTITRRPSPPDASAISPGFLTATDTTSRTNGKPPEANRGRSRGYQR